MAGLHAELRTHFMLSKLWAGVSCTLDSSRYEYEAVVNELEHPQSGYCSIFVNKRHYKIGRVSSYSCLSALTSPNEYKRPQLEIHEQI